MLEVTFPYIHQITATDVAQLAIKANPKRVQLIIYNASIQDVDLTSSKRTPFDKGMRIPAREDPQSRYYIKDYCQGAYWLICEAGKTASVRIEEDILK